MDFKKILFKTNSIDVEHSLPDALIFINKDGKIQWVNDVSAEIFETSKMHLMTSNVTDFIEGSKFIQPIAAAFIGLIPNCAISIGITMMLIKGSITFGAAMSGLLVNAGLGLLVLLKNNDFKDTLKIIILLVVISIVSGLAITFCAL